jgi:hypothetical protein
MESIRNLLKIIKNTVYASIFIVSTSYAGGDANSISNQKTSSDLYGSYSLSVGQLDLGKARVWSTARPTLYHPISLDGWVGKKLTQDTEGVIHAKVIVYQQSGNISQQEDDAIEGALNLDLLHLRHYENSTSFINLGYVFSEENENDGVRYSNGNVNSYLASIGYATDSLILGVGAGTTNHEIDSYYLDELIYYHVTYQLPISNKINLIASKHYSEYEKKLRAEPDVDDAYMDIHSLKATYNLENSFITVGGDSYTINNGSSELSGRAKTKMGSIYFSWTVPFGESPNNRTSFIMDNRPAVDEVIGFGGAL